MSSQNDQFYFIWKDMEFQPATVPPSDPNIPSMTIDLREGEIKVYLPENCSLITRRTINRRVDSIVRTGILTPEDPPRRVGMRFQVLVLGSKERINPTLLTPGHEYSKSSVSVEAAVQEESIMSAPSPVTPSLEVPDQPSLPASFPASTSAVQAPVESVAERIAPESMEQKAIPVHATLGMLITELLRSTEDLYLTRLDNQKYHLESELGAIVFTYDPDANRMELVETARFPDDLEKRIRKAFS